MKLAVVSHPCITPVNQDFYARVQAQTGWDVTILLPRRWKTEYGWRRVERWPAFRGGLTPLPVAPAGNIPLHAYIARVRRRLQALRPDVVYVHNEPYAVSTFQFSWAAHSLDGVPVGFYSAQNLNKRYPWPVRRWERWVHAHADFALPVSATVADVLRDKGFANRIEIVPLPVDVERLYPTIESSSRDDRPFTAAYVGRVAVEKGLDTLITALSLLPKEDVRLLIAGDGPALHDLRAQAESLGVHNRVSWEGYVPHESIMSVYRRADVLIVPSRTVRNWKEQFGRVVIESLACGVPVITSDSGELPQLMAQTGGGWTFAEGNADALARAIRQVIANPGEARERAERGRRAVERVFSTDAVARQFVAVVEDVVRGSCPRATG
jgi:glycosyltransferase involved in cell wall biosynthesis